MSVRRSGGSSVRFGVEEEEGRKREYWRGPHLPPPIRGTDEEGDEGGKNGEKEEREGGEGRRNLRRDLKKKKKKKRRR